MRRSQSAHVNTRRLRKAKGILLAAAIRHKYEAINLAAVHAMAHRVYCKSAIGAMHTQVSICEQNNFSQRWIAA
jgi:hypothetical protein